MAFVPANLERVGGNIQQQFQYTTPDTIAVVTAAGYFGASRAAVGPAAPCDSMNRFDTILVVSETGGTPKIDNIFVNSARGVFPVLTSATEGVTAT